MLARGSRRRCFSLTSFGPTTTSKPSSCQRCQTGERRTPPSLRYVARTATSGCSSSSPRSAGPSLRIGRVYADVDGDLGDVFERVRHCESPQLLQALVLDLADPLARHVERAPDLVERPRLLAAQPVAELQHPPLPVRERAEDVAQQLLAQRRVGGLVGQRCVLVGEEVAELRLLLVADRLLERDGRLRRAQDLLDLVEREVDVARDLGRQRLAAELTTELALGADDLVELLDDVDGHPDRAPLVCERPRDCLPDPPGRVGRELVALAPVELLGGAHETDRAFLDQIEEREALVAVALRDRDDEAEIRLDHLLLRAMVAALDPLRELDLLGGGQQLDLADVLQEELERVGRDLADALVDPRRLLQVRLR